MNLDILRSRFQHSKFPGKQAFFSFVVFVEKNVPPKWSQLNRWGRSRILRWSFIWIFAVPFFARMFSSLEPVANLNIFGHIFILNVGLPFSWLIFYFSSLSFSIASFLYSIRCPSITRDYDGYSDFELIGKGGEQLIDYLHTIFYQSTKKQKQFMFGKIERVLKNHSDKAKQEEYIKHFKETFTGEDDETIYLNMFLKGQYQIPESSCRGAFWAIRDSAEELFPSSRFFCGLFYLLGFLLFAWVLVQNFVYVVEYLY